MRLLVSMLLLTMPFTITITAAYDLPPQITPAIREACETDVRRLCVRDGSTEWSVKTCVLRNLDRLNAQCRQKLDAAGLLPGGLPAASDQRTSSQ